MLKVTKFGGSSMADAGQYRKIRDILLADPARRVVVVSAAGKRDKNDNNLPYRRHRRIYAPRKHQAHIQRRGIQNGAFQEKNLLRFYNFRGHMSSFFIVNILFKTFNDF